MRIIDILAIGIEGDYYRLFGDLGKPYLYHRSRFKIINPAREPDWTMVYDKDIGDVWYPERLHRKGFFEDYFSSDYRIAFGACRWLIYYVQQLHSRRTDHLYDYETDTESIYKKKPEDRKQNEIVDLLRKHGAKD